MKKYNGFTLVELSVVVAIVGILAWAVAPNMRSFIANSASNSLSSTLLIDIMYARNHAISNEVIVKMIPIGTDPTIDDSSDTGLSAFAPNATGVNWGLGWVVFEDINDNDDVDAGERIIRNHISFGPDAHISSAPSLADLLDINRPIGFNALGLAYGQGANTGTGILTIATLGCAGPNARTIQINQIGQVIGNDIDCPSTFSNQ